MLAETPPTQPARGRQAPRAGLARHRRPPPSPPWPRPTPAAGPSRFVLDAATASIALYAIAAHAAEREAHIREVQRYGQTLPEDIRCG